MSYHHNKQRWKKRGIYCESEMQLRSTGFNRRFYSVFNPKQTTVTKSETPETEIVKVDEERSFREGYEVLAGGFHVPKLRKWLEIMLKIEAIPPITLSHYHTVNKNNSNGDIHSSYEVHLNNLVDSDGEWGCLLLLLWSAYVCSDVNDDLLNVFLSERSQYEEKCTSSNKSLKPKYSFIGLRFVFFRLLFGLEGIWSNDVSELLLLCPKYNSSNCEVPIYNLFANICDEFRILPLSLLSLSSSSSDINVYKRCVEKCLLLEKSAAKIPLCCSNSLELLPFHISVLSGKAWNEGVGAICAANPSSCMVQEPFLRWLPIHFAAFNKSTPKNVIDELVQLKPECVCVKDIYGRLPLHLCEKREWREGTLTIFNSFPSGKFERDCEGRLPILSMQHELARLYHRKSTGPLADEASYKNSIDIDEKTCSSCEEDRKILTIRASISSSVKDGLSLASLENVSSKYNHHGCDSFRAVKSELELQNMNAMELYN